MKFNLSKPIFSRHLLTNIIVVMAAILFHSYFKLRFDQWIVVPFLSTIKSNILNDIIFVTGLCMIVVFSIRNIINNLPVKFEWLFLIICMLSFYVYCRITGGYYHYEEFKSIVGLRYADVFHTGILICVVPGIYYGCLRKRLPLYHSRPFLVDVPIKKGTQDMLNRERFAKRIAHKIQSLPNKKDSGALAIGIVGEWGSGKTSFSNMIAEAIELENRIVLDFNPWRSSTPQKIIEDFFELLIAELGKFDSTLSNNISSYAKTLTKIDENLFTKGMQTFTELFESSNKNEIYNSINHSIEDTKKQIIIFIDDLDRLDRREIIEVLRIIRNTANFNNLVYIVSYDQQYVLDAVKSFSFSNFSSYLEKIFQFEFTLPMFEAGIIRNYLKNILKEELPAHLHEQIDGAIESRAKKSINFTNEIISTHRAAIRLANAINFELEGLEDEVLFYDFYLLQLFKLRYPKIFKYLFDNSTIFFIPDFKNKDKYYRLRENHERSVNVERLEFMRMMDLNSSNGDNRTVEEKETIFRTWLRKMVNENELTENDVYLIETLLSDLLDAERDLGMEFLNRKALAFARVNNFYKYFAFELMEGEISASEFNTARNGTWENYKIKIEEWSSNGKSGAFIDRLLKIETFATIQEFENQVRALFELGRVYADTDNIYGFDIAYLLTTLDYPLAKPDRKLYDSSSDFKRFFKLLTTSAPHPRKFENYLFSMMMDRHADSLLSKEELGKLSMENFKEYFDTASEVSSQLWYLYHRTRLWDDEKRHTTKHPEAAELMRGLWRKSTNACELGTLIMQVNPDDEYFYLDESRWSFYFDSLDELGSWLSTADNIDRNSDCFKEFYSFFQLNKVNTSRGNSFEFVYIQPNRWR
ncbi:MAG: hypothetical protein EOO90_03840 [Pedobacter sp.]|nr:MAG: hypothetical protein EOO90_03840 [Pedobacter sp.]